MKLKVKPLKGGEFSLNNVELSNTVLEIKQMIQAAKGEEDFPVESQKLIHAGKIMKDESNLAEYKIKPEEEGGFIVCMISKKRQAKPEQSSSSAVQQPTPTPTPAPREQAQVQPTTSPARPVAAPNAGATAAAGVQITDEAVNDLVSMGFAETDARAALVAAYGNVQRACDYLLTGTIPEGAPGQAGGQEAGLVNESPLEAFRHHPQFNMIRQMVQTNPQALAQILQQIADADPELHAAIQADQDAFIRMLNEPITGGGAEDEGGPTPERLIQFLRDMQQLPEEERNMYAQHMGMGLDQLQRVTELLQSMPPEAIQRALQGFGGNPGFGGAMNQAPRLTPQEMEAVDRLSELGYSKAECLQAYLACDKDENAAANLLFQNPPEDDTQNDGMDTTNDSANSPPS